MGKLAGQIRALFSTTGFINILCWVAFLAIGIATKRTVICIVSFIFLVMALTRRKYIIKKAKAPELFWAQFVTEYPEMAEVPHQIWRVTDRPIDEESIINRIENDEVCGEAFCVDYFEYYSEPLPQVGAYYIICDQQNSPYFVVRTVEIVQSCFGDVSNILARIEGFKSASLWKSGNEDKFRALCDKADVDFSKETRVIFEKFEMVYNPK